MTEIIIDSLKVKLKDGREYQELQNKKLREHSNLTNDLNQLLRDTTNDKNE
jgi:hypothetical protein